MRLQRSCFETMERKLQLKRREHELILAYRRNVEMQKVIDRILGMDTKEQNPKGECSVIEIFARREAET